MYVTPETGLKIVDPFKKDFLPPEGREVVDDSYWRRLERDGDVTTGNAVIPAAPAAKAQTT